MQEYYDRASECSSFTLCIMGKDPYPQDAIGVPFCKPDWESMIADNCSGYHVLKSLGIFRDEQSLERLRNLYSQPIEIFLKLLDLGIVFINLSNVFVGEVIRKGRHREHLVDTLDLNKPILDKSDHVILCGEAWKHTWYGDWDDSFYFVVHPDIRNRNKPQTSTWWTCWWGSNALVELLGLDLEI
ncbi:hypothetical protein ABXV18_06670 [Vibrio owensii]|uniref:hypothetical protein n=1 Tax=Vibrio owensii TaxID=696485 RepID=UPI00339B96D2